MTQPFHFPNGQLANNAEELIELCQQHPDEGTNYLVKQDIERWLAYIGSYEIAECAANARQTEVEDRQKLENFLQTAHSLTLEKAVPAASTETQVPDNLSASASTSMSSPEIEQTRDEVTDDSATPPIQATEPAIEESKQLAAVESALIEQSDDSATPPIQATEPAIEESKQLAAVESELIEQSDESTTATAKTPRNAAVASSEKPSFFQVIAKFIVKILYRNKS